MALVDLRPADVTGRDVDADRLIKFLLTLTDERVRNDMAPFDHPQLFIPNGHPGDRNAVTQFNVVDGVKQAVDITTEIPAVGSSGRQAAGLAPWRGFLGTGAIQSLNITLKPGWNTLSTPIKLHSSMDTWGEFVTSNNLSYQAAYSWNGSAFQVVGATYVLSPLDAIFVQMNTPAAVQIIPFEGVSAPPGKTLVPGWNLVGSAFLETEKPVKDALNSAFFAPQTVPNAVPLWGYSQIVSPSVNTFEWTYVRDTLTIPNMRVGEGYWVAMVNGGQVSGFTSTPLPFPR
ncbi:MAG: hypothetical protein HY668_00175 [Chloroflexi bacterium]|nr:hypothetical protein [Chloroflexota bacterium]